MLGKSGRPTEVQEQPLHSKRCTAWCALSAHGIIGSFWFEDEEGGTLTVTQVNYRNILDKFCAALGQYRQDAWLQQDGAPPHTARLTMAYLQDRFGDRLISKGAEFQWVSHSPDFSVLISFERRVNVKEKVYVTDAIHGSKLQIWLFHMVIGNRM